MSENTSSKTGPQRIRIKDIQLKCTQCGHDEFWSKKYLLNTKITTFIGWDALDEQADSYICDKCKNIMWFYDKNK